MAVRSTDDDA
jgi:hypothetical protein